MVKEKISGVDQEEKHLRDSQRWGNWLDQFESDVDSKKDYSDEEKKEFLMGFVEKIVVHFDPDHNKHSLEIEFNLPIVHDELSYRHPERPIEGWDVLGGDTRVGNELKVSRGGRPSSHK